MRHEVIFFRVFFPVCVKIFRFTAAVDVGLLTIPYLFKKIKNLTIIKRYYILLHTCMVEIDINSEDGTIEFVNYCCHLSFFSTLLSKKYLNALTCQ